MCECDVCPTCGYCRRSELCDCAADPDMPVVLHTVFSPTFIGGLALACESAEKQGLALLRVVPHHQYEAVAVFTRPVSVIGDGMSTEPGGSIAGETETT
jgi:hypothetical protein